MYLLYTIMRWGAKGVLTVPAVHNDLEESVLYLLYTIMQRREEEVLYMLYTIMSRKNERDFLHFLTN